MFFESLINREVISHKKNPTPRKQYVSSSYSSKGDDQRSMLFTTYAPATNTKKNNFA